MTTILISYRRSDSKGISGRIFDKLVEYFGEDCVFMDVDNIPFGMDFRDHIAEILGRTDILLAIVGREWVGQREDGTRRIDDEADLVRIEVEAALGRSIPVIPVLVEGASMPSPSALPPSIQAFAYRNAAEIDSGRDFHAHMERLIRSMDQLLNRGRPGATIRPVADVRFEPPGPGGPARGGARLERQPSPSTAGANSPSRKAPIGHVVRWRGTIVVSRFLIGFAIAFAAFTLIEILAYVGALNRSDTELIDFYNKWNEQSLAAAAIIQIGLMVSFFIWMFRSTANLYFLNLSPVRITPGWAVGWYFIPIVNAWKGFSAANQLWRASPDGEITEQSSTMIWWWWLTLVAWSVVTAGATTMAEKATTIDVFRSAVAIYVIGGMLGILAAVLLVVLTRTITRKQYGLRHPE